MEKIGSNEKNVKLLCCKNKDLIIFNLDKNNYKTNIKNIIYLKK